LTRDDTADENGGLAGQDKADKRAALAKTSRPTTTYTQPGGIECRRSTIHETIDVVDKKAEVIITPLWSLREHGVFSQ
jgi:hypothetical protein